MSTLKSFALVGLLAAVSAAPASAGTAGWDFLWAFDGCGGSNFATCMSVQLYQSGNIIAVSVTNTTGPGTFTRVGVVNVHDNTVTEGTGVGPGRAWNWEANQGLSGDGLPETIWAYQAPPSPMKNGIAPGESGFFTFVFNTAPDLRAIGFAVHAQGGPGDCSTKFGVWNGGADDNDAGPAGYAADCVSVPEPGSMALLATGLAGLAFVASRRRNGLDLIDEDGNEI